MHKEKIIFLNGPAGSGKDSAIGNVSDWVDWEIHPMKFAAPLKNAVHSLIGMPEVSHSHFEQAKDSKHPAFFGATPRQFYIALSEDFAKPHFGEDFFGKVAVNTITSMQQYISGDTLYIFTDSGFRNEAFPVMEAFGPKNCLLIHCQRKFHTFTNDSRSYIELPSCTTINLTNDGTLSEWQDKVRHTVLGWANSWV